MSTSRAPLESEIQKTNDHLLNRKVPNVDEISIQLCKEAGLLNVQLQAKIWN